jgi:hypothetical protein
MPNPSNGTTAVLKLSACAFRVLQAAPAMQGAVAACIKDWKVDTLQELVAKAYTWDVFISHAGRDADKRFALQLWDLLDKPGIGLRTFLDERSLRIGEDAGPQMTEAMKSSRVGLLLLSREFFQRDSTKEELGFLLKRAVLQRIKLLPVFLRMTTEECAAELEAAFPGWLCGRSLQQWMLASTTCGQPSVHNHEGCCACTCPHRLWRGRS